MVVPCTCHVFVASEHRKNILETVFELLPTSVLLKEAEDVDAAI